MKIDFRPELFNSLGSYDRARLFRDIGAGFTVGVVALPLAMAFAIASGLKPESGIFTAIIAGFLISALGGSRVQIGGPAGAFIVIVYGIVQRYGLGNLIIATAMSGVLLFVMGMLKLGTLIRFIPISVVIGFTNGIAVLIGLSQIKDFLGLQVKLMPADFFGIIATLGRNLHSVNPYALLLAATSLALIILWQLFAGRIGPASLSRWLPIVPGSIVALLAATTAASTLDLPVDTIGSRFGGIPATLPSFALPDFTWETAKFLLIPTTTLTLLGAIESLLCARVADGMIDARHNPNQELMAQGIANFLCPFFGGMPATGTIARTVTNIKNGGSSPVAGMVHSVTLLLIILIAAPFAKYIPLACLSAILMFVAWNMGEWRAFTHLRHFRMPYRVTLLAVFFLTVVFDLTVAVEVGLLAACLTFIYRISSLTRCEQVPISDFPELTRFGASDPRLACYRLYGAIFFGAVKLIEDLQDHLPTQVLMLDLKNVLYIDSSGVDTLNDLARSCQQQGVQLLLCGLDHQPLDIARRSGLVSRVGDEQLYADLAAGVAAAVARTRTGDASSKPASPLK